MILNNKHVLVKIVLFLPHFFLLATDIYSIVISGFTTHCQLHPVRTARTTAIRAATVVDLQSELNAIGLGVCHGPLHATGVRCIADLNSLTADQLEAMREVGAADPFDYKILQKFVTNSAPTTTASTTPTTTTTTTESSE
mmetsp:Transcript_41563/g.45113  ORF Transcript_41563/g.45113 Transcript_41563/m.45113 type:complete len:140 (-) Transcript_41563:354-773(-)